MHLSKTAIFLLACFLSCNGRHFVQPFGGQQHFGLMQPHGGQQFGIEPFISQPVQHSSAQANANAFSNQFGHNGGGFGSSASNAGAQSFNSGGPLGNFGASAANSMSQGFGVHNGMLQGNANAAGTQTYKFGDKQINVAYSSGWGIGPDGRPAVANSNSITYTK